MSFETLFNSLRSAFAEIALPGNIPVAYPNAPFGEPPSGRTWMRVTVLPGRTGQASMGSPGKNRFRTPGVLEIQVFTPLERGDKSVNGLADIIADGLRNRTLGSHTRLRAPYVTVVGRHESWWQQNVTVPFESDALH